MIFGTLSKNFHKIVQNKFSCYKFALKKNSILIIF